MTKDTGRASGPTEEFTPIWGPHLTRAKDALAVGAKYYFNGRACRRGHIAPRYAHGACTACKEEDRRNNSEANKEYFRQWRLDNPDKTEAYHKAQKEAGYEADYYRRNRDEVLQRKKKWREDNPDKAKAINKKTYEKHKEKIRAKAREKYAETGYDKGSAARYREKNRAKLARRTAEWRTANPELVRVMDRNKKHKRRGAEGSHTLADVQAILLRQGYKCAECGTSVKNEYHVDHIHPLSKGGTNWPSNLQALCPPCNLHKHATDPIVFAQRKGRLL